MPYFIIQKKCTGCSACSRQCPAEAINGIFRDYYAINIDICIECGLCGMICPEKAVLDPSGNICQRIPRQDRPVPIVDRDMCNACETCVMACPSKCRGVTGKRSFQGISKLKFPGLCTHCGECQRFCIKEAVVLRKGCPEQVLID